MTEPTKPELWYSIQFVGTWKYYQNYDAKQVPSTITVSKLIDAYKMTLEHAKHQIELLYPQDETQIVVNPFVKGH